MNILADESDSVMRVGASDTRRCSGFSPEAFGRIREMMRAEWGNRVS